MTHQKILPATLQFLENLAQNNNKEWFNAHKPEYQQARDNMAAFARELLMRMQDHDSIVTERSGDNLYRIYNDLRFHKNKPPFNPRFAGGFHRVKPLLRGGYYFQVMPGNSYVSCGFFGPNKDDLMRIRKDIEANYWDWEEMLVGLYDSFGEMQGDELKRVPQGFPQFHLGGAIMKHKQFIFRHHFEDYDVMQADFVERANDCFKAIRPFFDYMSELLTTDGNGVSLY